MFDMLPETIAKHIEIGPVHPVIGTNCWNWTAGCNRGGYGQVRFGDIGPSACRVVYQLSGFTIPQGLHLDHKCRNRKCVNPDHLRPVTARENVLMGEGLAAANARKQNCKNGHPLLGDNLYVFRTPSGKGRACKACRLQNTINWRRGRQP